MRLHHLGYGVVTVPAPWVTAANALYGKPATFKGTVLFNCLYTILTASRCVTATWRQQGGNKNFVGLYNEDEQPA